MVFNNNSDHSERGTTLGGNQTVALHPHTDSTSVRFPTSDSDPFYTNTRGKWQQLANGNMLLTESNAGRVVELTPDGRTVWEWIHAPYEGNQVPVVTKGTRYGLSEDDVAAWPCAKSRSRRGSSP